MEQMSNEITEQRNVDTSLATTISRFNDAFNRFDAKAVASFWADDGTLLNPLGNYGDGRSGVERVFEDDAKSLLEGSTSRFTIQRARPVGDDCTLLDVEHEAQNCRMPNGSTGTMKMHVIILARRRSDRWEWLDVRPYAFLQRPRHVH